jgi:predicted nucleotidyltransferase component of viral defense system
VASLRDIGAMKLVAISQRSTMRDYVDLHAITKKIPLREITTAWKKKYPLADLGTPLRALTYFQDVDSDEKQKMPAMLNGVTWDQVKQELSIVVERYNSKGIER